MKKKEKTTTAIPAASLGKVRHFIAIQEKRGFLRGILKNLEKNACFIK